MKKTFLLAITIFIFSSGFSQQVSRSTINGYWKGRVVPTISKQTQTFDSFWNMVDDGKPVVYPASYSSTVSGNDTMVIKNTANQFKKIASSNFMINGLNIYNVGSTIGINNSTPWATSKLDVKGIIRSSAITGSGAIDIAINSNNGYVRADETTSDLLDIGGIRKTTLSTYNDFKTGFQERVSLASDGKLGINNLTPGSHLDVKGSARISRGLELSNTRLKSVVYCFGTSITYAGPYEDTLATMLGANWYVDNKGVGGNTTAQMLARLDDEIIHSGDAEYLIIEGGINDITGGVSALVIRANLQSIYTAATAAYPTIKVVALTIAPFKGSALWTAARQLKLDSVNTWIMATATGVNHKVDIYAALQDTRLGYLKPSFASADSLHLSSVGYKKMGSTIHAGVVWTQSGISPVSLNVRGVRAILVDHGSNILARYSPDAGAYYSLLGFGSVVANTVELSNGSVNTNIYGNITTFKGNTVHEGRLTLKAGGATVEPLKFVSGVNLSTAVAGAMEYNGTNLFFTRSGTTRESIISANAVNTVSPTAPNRTITVVIDGATYYIQAKTTND